LSSDEQVVSTSTKFDLDLEFTLDENDICRNYISYATSRFDNTTILTMAKRWTMMMETIFNNDNNHDLDLRTLSLVLPEEINLYTWVNQNAIQDFGQPMSVADAILQNAEKYSDKTAVVFENQKLSYSQLVKRAGFVAKTMTEKGIQKGDVVIQCIDRSLHMIIGMVAIQLVGAVYCAVHPEDPVERIKHVVYNVNAKCVLSLSNVEIEFPVHLLQLDKLQSECEWVSEQKTNPEDPCYLITTSGSTGKPKTLAISHGSYFNLCQGVQTSDLALQATDVQLLPLQGWTFWT